MLPASSGRNTVPHTKGSHLQNKYSFVSEKTCYVTKKISEVTSSGVGAILI
jgi:hypothetical protein